MRVPLFSIYWVFPGGNDYREVVVSLRALYPELSDEIALPIQSEIFASEDSLDQVTFDVGNQGTTLAMHVWTSTSRATGRHIRVLSPEKRKQVHRCLERSECCVAEIDDAAVGGRNSMVLDIFRTVFGRIPRFVVAGNYACIYMYFCSTPLNGTLCLEDADELMKYRKQIVECGGKFGSQEIIEVALDDEATVISECVRAVGRLKGWSQ